MLGYPPYQFKSKGRVVTDAINEQLQFAVGDQHCRSEVVHPRHEYVKDEINYSCPGYVLRACVRADIHNEHSWFDSLTVEDFTCIGILGEKVKPRPTREGRVGDSQPMPKANDHPIVHHEVQKDLEARLQLGITRYGQPLQPFNGRSFLQDAYDEILDLAVYLKGRLMEEAGS